MELMILSNDGSNISTTEGECYKLGYCKNSNRANIWELRGRERGGSTNLKIYSSFIFMSHLILSKIENFC